MPTNPVTDSGTGFITFSGGSATTAGSGHGCGQHRALLALSVNGIGGYQFLDLGSNPTLEPAFTTQDPNGDISGSPLIDSVHQLILSAAEDNDFEAIDVASTMVPPSSSTRSAATGRLDSTAESSTGIVDGP